MIDDSFNKKQYEKYLHYYLDSNADQHVGGGTAQSRVEFLKKHLPIKSHIFEIGSGGGTDALALQNAGYTVTASDFSEKFVEVLLSKHLSAVLFDAKRGILPNTADAIYANAVFVHFLPNELKKFLNRVKNKLQKSKIIYLSVIKGEGNERKISKSGFNRDFQYYSEDLLKKILSESGFKILEIQFIDKWIQIVAQA